MDKIKVIGARLYIELGSDGGPKGGEIIALGTPQEIMANVKSVTGKSHFLNLLKENS
ncbi:MAG: hypothetical protein ACTSPN_15275 [Promethearchaeota archaeon]